jgi:hypothetical protein
VLWIFLGAEFTAAEFVGGFVLILLMWVGVHMFVSRRDEEDARAHAQEADTGHVHTIASRERPRARAHHLRRGVVGCPP